MACKIINPASDRHRIQLEHMGKILGLRSIKYKDHGNKEEYELTNKDGESVTIHCCGGREGGFLSVDCNLEPLEMK